MTYIKTFLRVLLLADIYRVILLFPVLMGVLCGVESVYVYKKEDGLICDNCTTTVRVDFYGNRRVYIGLLLTGIILCAVELIMAISLDNIITKNLRKDCLTWLGCDLFLLAFRNGFNDYLGKYEEQLGLHRMGKDMTPSMEQISRLMFRSTLYYEIVKGVKFLLVAAVRNELKDRQQRSKVNVEDFEGRDFNKY